jgi:signal transduction histidine kinase
MSPAVPGVSFHPSAVGGEAGRLIRARDWSATPIGPLDTWPRSLKSYLNAILELPTPAIIFWGAERIQIYNDGYAVIMGPRHPHYLGATFRECWPEAYHTIDPWMQKVLHNGERVEVNKTLIPLTRHGFTEESYFTFSFSPLRDDADAISGILQLVTETTDLVLSERRASALLELSNLTVEAQSVEATSTLAARVLTKHAADFPFCLIYLADPLDPRILVRAASAGLPDGDARFPARIDLTQSEGMLAEVSQAVEKRELVAIENLAARLGPLSGGPWPEPARHAAISPIASTDQQSVVGVLISGISPRLVLDQRYRDLLDLAAAHLARSLGAARAHEDERRRVQAMAELDRAKTEFFANVSHEFRTPLTLLLGPLETLLADQALEVKTRQQLCQMHRNALRLLRLVNALLDFSRMEAGRHSARFVPTDLARYTADLASAFESAFEKAGLSFAVDCAPLDGPMYVDRDMWEKIVMNLLSNALKFTFEGGVTMQLAPTTAGARLTVKDSGTGIPRSELPRLFQRFHRVEGARSRSHEGTGIGLALAHELVKLHGGDLRVTSEVGRGTEFAIELRTGRAHLPPEHVAESSDAAATVRSAAAYLDEALQWLPYGSQPVASTSARSGARVLVADDNRDLRTFLSSLISPHYEVQAVADGREALTAVQARKPDLVLSDVMMPNLDGLGLVRALRDNPETRTLPVILLSARAGQGASLEGLAAGADDYLAKPFTSQELLARVRTHLTMARARDELLTRLTQANEDLRAFSSSVSHDLRAPLRALDAFAGILEEDHGPELNDEAKRKISMIRDSVRQLSAIVDALLGVSRIGYQAIRIEVFETDALVTRVCNELTAVHEGTAVEISIGKLPQSRGDRALLRQVWVNLISNAMKYSGTRPYPRVQISGFDAADESVFCVKDNGVGFDMSNVDRLFGIFQRLHRSDEFPGSGVGLATVKRIVEKHLGRVWAESAVNNGAAFFFSLPREDAQKN